MGKGAWRDVEIEVVGKGAWGGVEIEVVGKGVLVGVDRSGNVKMGGVGGGVVEVLRYRHQVT